MSPHIVVYGAGAIGATVGGWLTEVGRNVTFVERAESARLLREQGLRVYCSTGRKPQARCRSMRCRISPNVPRPR